MKKSQILVPKVATKEPALEEQSKFASSYLSERDRLELAEVEICRSKVIVLDSKGNIIRHPLFLDH